MTWRAAQVLDAMEEYYRLYNSNVHRGVHALSARATTAYEEARDKVRAGAPAASPAGHVFSALWRCSHAKEAGLRGATLGAHSPTPRARA